MSGGGEEFETPPASPSYSPQPSDSEEDGEDMSVASDNSGGPGWWTDEMLAQREQERVERCIYLANAAHKELESVLPEDICPTLETVLGYTSTSRWVTGIYLRAMCTLTLGSWRNF